MKKADINEKVVQYLKNCVAMWGVVFYTEDGQTYQEEYRAIDRAKRWSDGIPSVPCMYIRVDANVLAENPTAKDIKDLFLKQTLKRADLLEKQKAAAPAVGGHIPTVVPVSSDEDAKAKNLFESEDAFAEVVGKLLEDGKTEEEIGILYIGKGKAGNTNITKTFVKNTVAAINKKK